MLPVVLFSLFALLYRHAEGPRHWCFDNRVEKRRRAGLSNAEKR